MSGSDAETSSRSFSESNSARNPTNRSGSLSTTAMRMDGFLVGTAFIAVAAFMDFILWLRYLATKHSAIVVDNNDLGLL